jgi:outer membrane protein OmpA-like peptidoglycan-associated protein
LVATKSGYFNGGASFSVEKKEDNDTLLVNVYIKKIPIGPLVIKNIFYDFDKATLRPESFPALDSLYDVLSNNPSIVVEIRSHTDSKGNDDYNMKLSQNRAQSVVNYMVKKGITVDRLKATGMGETEPIAPNEINGKDNPEGRQLNRRTDFKIIGLIPGKEIIYKQGSAGFDENAVDTLEEQKKQE